MAEDAPNPQRFKDFISGEKQYRIGRSRYLNKASQFYSNAWHGQFIDRWRGKYSLSGEVIFKVGNYGFKTKDEAKAFIDS